MLGKSQKMYVLFDVTWRKNDTSYVMGTTTLLIGILTRKILKPTRSLYDFRFKSDGSNSGFRVFGCLDLDLWPMFYFLSHALRMMYWNIHAKFHMNPSSVDGWYAADTHTHTLTYLLTYTHTHLLIAQLVERQTSIHEVVGSSPTRRSNFFKFKSV